MVDKGSLLRLTDKVLDAGFAFDSVHEFYKRGGWDRLVYVENKFRLFLYRLFYIFRPFQVKNRPTVILDVERFNHLDKYLTAELESRGYRVFSRTNRNLYKVIRLHFSFAPRQYFEREKELISQKVFIPEVILRYLKNQNIVGLITQDTHTALGKVMAIACRELGARVFEFQHGYLQDEFGRSAFPLMSDFSFQWDERTASTLNDVSNYYNHFTTYKYLGYFGDIVRYTGNTSIILVVLADQFIESQLSLLETLLMDLRDRDELLVIRPHPRTKISFDYLHSIFDTLKVDSVSPINTLLQSSCYVIGQPSSVLSTAFNSGIKTSQLGNLWLTNLDLMQDIPVYPKAAKSKQIGYSSFIEFIWKELQ